MYMRTIGRARRRAVLTGVCLAAYLVAAAVAGAPADPSPLGHGASLVSVRFSGRVASASGGFAHYRGQVAIVMVMRSRTGRGAVTLPMTIRLRPRPCPATGRCVRLSGTLTGRITFARYVPDVGEDDAIKATGRIRPLGVVRAHGQWSIPGFIVGAHESFQLTLSAPLGRLVIHAA